MLTQPQSSLYSPPPVFVLPQKPKGPKVTRVRHQDPGNSSKALSNPLADVSLAYGVASMIRRERKESCKKNKTVFALIDRVLAVTMETMHLWQGMLSVKACKRVHDRCVEFQRVHFVNGAPPFVYTQFCLMVLADRCYRKHPKYPDYYLHKREQRQKLAKCIKAVERLNCYFDSKTDKPIGYYNKAEIAYEAWKKMEGQ